MPLGFTIAVVIMGITYVFAKILLDQKVVQGFKIQVTVFVILR